jgi:hypothetical protein
VVTERGIAINPRRQDLLDAVKGWELPIRPLREIKEEVERICGVKPSDRLAAIVRWPSSSGSMVRCSIRFGRSPKRGVAAAKQALGGEVPAFFFHLAVGPVLELFEERRFDHCEADADAAFLADPHKTRFRLEEDIGLGQHEADVD